MNPKAAAVLGFILLGLFGCGATTKLAIQDVETGMTSAQVSNMLGEPRNRSFEGEYEAWLYSDPVSFGMCAHVTIWFEDTIVLSMSSIRYRCRSGRPPPNWDKMPNSMQSSSGTPASAPAAMPPQNQSVPERDKYADLEQLKDLLDDGALTQEEYDREKAKILDE